MKTILAAVSAALTLFGCAAADQAGSDGQIDPVEDAIAWAGRDTRAVEGSLPEKWFVELTVVDLPPKVIWRLLLEQDRQGNGLFVTRRPVHTAAAWVALRDDSADTRFVGRKWQFAETGAAVSVEAMRGEWYTPHVSEPETWSYPSSPVAMKVHEGSAVKFKGTPGQNGRMHIEGVVENCAVIRPYAQFRSGTSPTSMVTVSVPEVRRHDMLFSANVYAGDVIALCTEAWSSSGEPVQRLVTLSFCSELPPELRK